MFIDFGREIHEMVVIRNRPMLTCLEACIELLENREHEPAVRKILGYARDAVQREREFASPDFLNAHEED